jgi:hypothetical protein
MTQPFKEPNMFTKDDTDFIDFLFGKLTCLTDTDMIDLHDDDTCCDHLELKAAELEITVDELHAMLGIEHV